MKITVGCIFLLVSSAVFAQVTQIWGCRGTDSNGFNWVGGAWEKAGLVAEDFVIALDEVEVDVSTLEFRNSDKFNFGCYQFEEYWRCIGHVEGLFFVLNTSTGEAGLSKMHGALGLTRVRDPVSVSIAQCAKL